MYKHIYESDKPWPKIITLCGSTRFANEFLAMQFQETLQGRIVLSVGCFPRLSDGTWDHMMVSDEDKVCLDELHKRKIDLADEIVVINVGGYIGESTRSEIAYAREHQKPVRYRDVSYDGGRTWTVTSGVEVWARTPEDQTHMQCMYGEVCVQLVADPTVAALAVALPDTPGDEPLV